MHIVHALREPLLLTRPIAFILRIGVAKPEARRACRFRVVIATTHRVWTGASLHTASPRSGGGIPRRSGSGQGLGRGDQLGRAYMTHVEFLPSGSRRSPNQQRDKVAVRSASVGRDLGLDLVRRRHSHITRLFDYVTRPESHSFGLGSWSDLVNENAGFI